MKDEIESYREVNEAVLEQDDDRVVARLAGSVRNDQSVSFHQGDEVVWGRVVRQIGNGRVEIQIFEPPAWIGEATIQVHEQRPSLPLPWDVGPVDVRAISLGAPGEGPEWPPRSVSMTELSGVRSPMDTGIEAIDVLAPLVRGGFNLVIDASRDRDAFERLVAVALSEVDLDVRVDETSASYGMRRQIHAAGDVDHYERAMAAGLAWIAHNRHERSSISAVMELPVVIAEYGPDTTDESRHPASVLAEATSSTKGCEVTCIVRLPAATGPDGFIDIVETLALGEVDSQIFIDTQGRFDPTRSHSSAPVDDARGRERSQALSLIHRAERAGERQSIWGDDDLDPEELEALARADAFRVALQTQ